MKTSVISTTLIATLCAGTVSVAQSSAPRAAQRAVEMVEVVGCLAEEPAGTWVLTSASEPVASKGPATTAAALKEAAERPLGSRRFRLVGVSIFTPADHRGRKVAAKGLLIKDPRDSRLNVTSLQTVGTNCAR